MLNSYKLLSLRADLRYEKISFYKKYNAAGEYCEVLARQAKELLAARDNINAVVDSLAEPYRTVLYLRFIEGHTVEKTAEIMFSQIAITSWTPRGKNLGHGWSRRIYP